MANQWTMLGGTQGDTWLDVMFHFWMLQRQFRLSYKNSIFPFTETSQSHKSVIVFRNNVLINFESYF